jgi:CRISPR system Cascade subunit CasD
MTRFLVFQLYGPLASWGDVAVGEVRPSALHPGRSGVLGLVAACVGLKREDEEAQTSLSRSLGLAVLVRSSGTPVVDYHTAQVPGQKRGRTYATRRDQLGYAGSELNTILSRRHYRCDSFHVAALWEKQDRPVPTLSEVGAALNSPAFTPYLGRKACPCALPFAPRLVEASNLTEALRTHSMPGWPGVAAGQDAVLYWEAGVDAGVEPEARYWRYDEPLSRRRWQFGARWEHQAVLRGLAHQEE